MLSSSALAGTSFFNGLDTDFSGFIETRHGIQIQSPNNTQASETWMRLEGSGYTDHASFFTALNISENHLLSHKSGLLLHEAYVDTAVGNLELRVGRQIIIWGNSDATQITDRISPMDQSEYITRNFDETRMAVDALNLKYGTDCGDTQFIWIPRYRQSIRPTEKSPWYLGDISRNYPRLPQPDSEPESQTGTTFFDRGLADSELALKQSFFFTGWDMALSHFYTWQDNPVYVFEKISGVTHVRPRVTRQNITGLEFSKPFGKQVFRTEAAFFWKDAIQTRANVTGLLKRDRLKWLMGLDWYPGDLWTVALEYSESHILSPVSGMVEPSVRRQIYLRGSKKLFREKLTLNAAVYFDPYVRDSLVRISGEYCPMDDLVLSLGSDIFTQGVEDRSGNFAPYDNRDQIWARLKYYF